jgi:beta-galactosidase
MTGKVFGSVLAFVLVANVFVSAETYTGETSNRIKINMGVTPWKFTKSDPAGGAQAIAYNDAAWKDVGIPHTWNDTDTFINQKSGGGDGSMYGGINWYRKHFTLDNQYAGRKVFVEFEGAHVGAVVYINGTLIPGNSAVNPQCTHVIGFIGFVVDITQYVQFGGTDNVLAVRLSRTGVIYTDPGFSLGFRFGQSDGGLFRPVWMHITDKIHVPLNVYSVLNQWGTYVATLTASDASATVRMLTNVQNEGTAAQSVTVTTKVVDATNTVVLTSASTQSIGAGQSYVFDQKGAINNPHLWYPNNSPYGKPYMYKVYHIVKAGATTVDVFESPLGIRTITWDANFPYINGHKHLLFGASARYDYPALGTALPPEVEWRDAQILATIGGSLWRPGHSSCSPGFVDACDNTGVMLMQPSGEGEGAFATYANAPAARLTLKEEIQRDVIVRDRNHPSILAWETSNGDIDPGFADLMRNLNKTWDSLTPRAQSVRGGPEFAAGDLIACTVTGCEIGLKNGHPLCPAWGAEAWGRHSSRIGYDYELQFAEEFMQNWHKSIQANCFGLCQWYLAETPGEDSPFLEGGGDVRSFGSSMMDHNRLPKMLYKMYSVAWTPYSTKAQVYIAHHWNRTGAVRVNVFSNCPSVRLLINGTSQGTKTPNGPNGTGDDTNIGQNTTELPFQCYWNVTWASGTLRAEGLDAGGNVVCFDEKKTAGNPDHIVLSVDAPIVKPDGETFQITANATDAALILAKVVDASGNLCPTSSNLVTWSVTGPGNYRGGSDQFVTAGQPLGYHSPLDPELTAEGGMCKVAVRSTFTPGVVTVKATSPGLTSASATFTVVPVPAQTAVRRPTMRSLAQSPAMPNLAVRATGKTIRFYVSQPSFVSVEILDASGKILARMSRARAEEGWHPVQVSGVAGAADFRGDGVCFVRLALDGGYQYVKPVVLMR